jgi:SAM-dependent MidA family methyltransferase
MNPHSRVTNSEPVQFSADQSAHVQLVVESLRRRIDLRGGWIPFSDFMRFVLYEPGLGYYAAGAKKFGHGGDFVTAPNLSPLFGHTVARAIRPLMETRGFRILELGAGNGDLAHAMLSWLSLRGVTAEYRILELSADLRQRQAERLSVFSHHVEWLDRLPDFITGFVIANEVLDALPCERIVVSEGELRQVGVAGTETGFALKSKALSGGLDGALIAATQRIPRLEGYLTEINVEAEALVRTVTGRLRNATALWLDYGFPRSEYYHPQRQDGTLMCHTQHRAHSDPLFAPGLQDITAHVDFSAMAEAAREGGATQIAYTTQAQFLLEAGLLDELLRTGDPGSAPYLAAANQVNRLVSPAEMGELFKVMVVQTGDGPLPLGFSNEQSQRL